MTAELIRHENGIMVIRIPMKFKRRGGRREIILPPSAQTKVKATPMQMALARGFKWQKMLDTGEASCMNEIAEKAGLDSSFIARHVRLTLLAPDLVEAILDGKEPEGLTLEKLFRPIPLLWEEQRKLYGFSPNDE